MEQHENTELFVVPAGGQEWLDVYQLFNNTLDDFKGIITVTKIERVQNKWLWKKYCLQKELMIEKNGKIALVEPLVCWSLYVVYA